MDDTNGIPYRNIRWKEVPQYQLTLRRLYNMIPVMWLLVWQRTFWLLPAGWLHRTATFISLYGLQIERTWRAGDISGNSKVNLQLNLLAWNTVFCYTFDPSSSLFFSRWKEDTSKEMYTHTCTDPPEFMYRLLLDNTILYLKVQNTFCCCHGKELPSVGVCGILTSSAGSFSYSPFASMDQNKLLTC